MVPDKINETASPSRRFTYADYLELRGWEFDKFRSLPPIEDSEIDSVNWERLAADLPLAGDDSGDEPG